MSVATIDLRESAKPFYTLLCNCIFSHMGLIEGLLKFLPRKQVYPGGGGLWGSRPPRSLREGKKKKKERERKRRKREKINQHDE